MKAALVLAAGFGTRLRPYTEHIPKPLLPVGGIEPLFFALWRAKCMGAQKFYVNAHYHHEQVGRFLKDVVEPRLGVKTELLVENPILGTGGAIRNLITKADYRAFDELLVINGDTLLGLDKLDSAPTPDHSWCLVTADQEFLKKYKPLWIDDQSYYAGVGDIENPDRGWAPTHFLGLHVLKSDALTMLRHDKSAVGEQDLFRGIYRPMLDSGLRIEAVSHKLSKNDFWYDMTNKEFFLEAQSQLLGTVAKPESCWRRALEARWMQKAQEMGKSWLFGSDPGCVDWNNSKFSVVVSNSTSKRKGTLGLNSSVLILREPGAALGAGVVNNSLLMSAGLTPTHNADSNLESEIIFL